ncbi:MAG: type II toxin-antitoxin system VapC family toxin [Herpetosiphonaceae bacterium]|nr:type II toxin-antitoxin system VapC family toxin [Herpetosiphonaceae bacterium]
MPSTVYLETTIVSYLTGRSSRDLIVAAHQQLTQEWWDQHRLAFDLYISQLVIQEASAGDPMVPKRRLVALEGIPLLALTEDAVALARALTNDGPVPAKSAADALHIAVAAINGMEFLLTWNCKHIANAITRSSIEAICRVRGYEPPIICTPEELLGG